MVRISAFVRLGERKLQHETQLPPPWQPLTSRRLEMQWASAATLWGRRAVSWGFPAGVWTHMWSLWVQFGRWQRIHGIVNWTKIISLWFTHRHTTPTLKGHAMRRQKLPTGTYYDLSAACFIKHSPCSSLADLNSSPVWRRQSNTSDATSVSADLLFVLAQTALTGSYVYHLVMHTKKTKHFLQAVVLNQKQLVAAEEKHSGFLKMNKPDWSPISLTWQWACPDPVKDEEKPEESEAFLTWCTAPAQKKKNLLVCEAELVSLFQQFSSF